MIEPWLCRKMAIVEIKEDGFYARWPWQKKSVGPWGAAGAARAALCRDLVSANLLENEAIMLGVNKGKT